jgi:UDP-N-acetylmuramoyl-L-alanyl-D-glutamate--2,6-diaminopimelate ligase
VRINNKTIDYLEPVEICNVEDIENINITGISYDSRTVSKGNVFICIAGERFDGHNFIDTAVKAGAALIISQKNINYADFPVIRVKNTKIALAKIANLFFGFPSKKIDLIGVTGTNGKTTTTHLIETIFEKAGIKCALIGTLGSRLSSSEEYSSVAHTTPQAPELQESLKKMYGKGIKKVVMEVSSHSLDQERVTECDFSGAVFTNLTQDHLDYHITMDNYFNAKSRLFKMVAKSSHENKYAVVNLDDKYSSRLIDLIPKDVRVITYGIKNNSDVWAKDIVISTEGSEYSFISPVGNGKMKLHLTGQFNVYNSLAALCVGIAEGIDIKTCINALESVSGVPGRFEVVSRKPLVIVDYAHTPDGLQNVLNAAEKIVSETGRLICVFGCGGDRDVTKRPQMGRIAENLCDKVIVTSDNPRTEDPQQIITDILTGIQELDSKGVTVEPDRAVAIEQAILNSAPDDVIVIAGKGHEDYQIINYQKFHFDDREEARKALQKITTG